MSSFVKATRTKSKLRLAIDGPPGSGKSFTLLRIAFWMAHKIGPNCRVAAIDTEHGSLSLYQGLAPDGVPFNFDVNELSNFAPTEYTSAILQAAKAGYGILIIDGLSHAWSGEGGALEIKDKSSDTNSYTAWRNVTPMHNRMIDTIISSPMHILVSMRSKMDYVLETNEKGKQVPKKVGMAPIQRQGMEYEFGIYASMDAAHVMTVSKARCEEIQDLVMVKPGPAFADMILNWLETGSGGDAPEDAFRRNMVTEAMTVRIVRLATEAEITGEALTDWILKRFGVDNISLLTEGQANETAVWLEQQKKLTDGKRAARNRTASGTGTALSVPTALTSPSAPTKEPSTNGTSMDLARLRELKEAWHQANGHSEEAKPNAWKELLGRFGHTSAKNMNENELAALIAALKPIAASPSVLGSPPITQEQLEELARIRLYMNAAKGFTEAHKEDSAKLWRDSLAPWGVTSAKQLTTEKAAEVIEKLRAATIPY